MKNIIAIVGSNSNNSTNRKLLEYIKNNFFYKAKIELVEVKGLPIFNKPSDGQIPEQAKIIAEKIEKADGVIIATPEYDHAPPASLLNALAWLSYRIHPLMDKPVMIAGASYGALGSSRAQSQLKQILDSPEIKARLMPSSDFLLSHSLKAFDKDGGLVRRDDIIEIEAIFEDFLIFIDIVKNLVNVKQAHQSKLKKLNWEEL